MFDHKGFAPRARQEARRPRTTGNKLSGVIASLAMVSPCTTQVLSVASAGTAVGPLLYSTDVFAAGGNGGASGGGEPGGPGGSTGSAGTNGSSETGNPFFNGGGGGGGGGAGGFNGGQGGGSTLGGSGAGGTSSSRNGIDGGTAGGLNSTGGSLDAGGGGGGYGGANGNAAGSPSLSNTMTLNGANGGSGGAGGDSNVSGSNGTTQAEGGGGGGGGAGGYGAIVTGTNAMSSNTGMITGGTGGGGGHGGNATTDGATASAGNGGSGGDGGVGVQFTGAGMTFTNSGMVIGGNGGAGGAGGLGNAVGMNTVTSMGAPGTAGLGGVGITGANLSIINSGTIKGGVSGAATPVQADAVLFTGGVNNFTITSTSMVTGKVVATGSGNDTFGLGGPGNATFNLGQLGAVGSATAQYQGFGILQKSGTSTWTLSGAPSDGVTPAYQVTAGTLNLGGTTQQAASLVVTGGTLAGGTLVIQGQTNVQSGTISANLASVANQAFTKTTTGTVILSGTNTFVGAMTVTGGTLEVDGSTTFATAANVNGGTLSGIGSFTSPNLAINGGGTLSPGSIANPYGALMVNTLTFAAGSFYNVSITPTQNSRTNVANTATINGGTVNVAAGAGRYATRQYTILNATGNVTGTFTGVTSNLAFLMPTLTYDAHDVFLNITGNGANGSVNYRTAARTQNQYNVASGLTEAGKSMPGGAGGRVLDGLNQLTVTQAQAAFDALSGEGITATQNLANRSAQMFNDAIFDQTTFYGNGGAGNQIVLTDAPPAFTAYAPLTGDRAPLYGPPVRELADLPASHIAPTFVAPTRTWRAWASGFGGTEDIHGNGAIGSAAQDNTIYGGALGVDYQVTPNYLFGVAVGGSDGDFQVPGRTTYGSTTGGHIAIYDLATFGSFYGASSSSFSYFNNRTTRFVGGFGGFGGLGSETERGDFDSHEYRTRLEFGRHVGGLFGFGGTLTPFIALEIAELRSNGFGETAVSGPGLFRLNVSGQSAADVPGYLGLRYQTIMPLGGMAFLPSLQVAYVHEFAPYRSQIGAIADLPGSTFLVDGARPARDAAQVKAGGELKIGPNSALFANFDGEFSGVNQLYAGKGGFRYVW